MITKTNVIYIIIFVLLVAAFLFTRFFKINEIPSSLYWDEASIGYNAYSILETGKDEWGEFLPVHFRAFGEFKLPVYIYSVSITTKLFGLSTFAVRLPAVFYSLATIIIINFLVTKVFKNKWMGLASMFFLITSPWLFLFSRTGYEATAGIFFYALSLYFFIISLENRKYFLFSTLALILSFYSYNSFRIVAPISFVIFSIYYLFVTKTKLKSGFIFVSFAFVVFITSMFPFYRLVRQDFGLSRLSAVQEKSVSKIFSNYVSHFSPTFLFYKGDRNPRSHAPGAGQIWFLDAVLVGVGIFVTIKSKNKLHVVIFLGFLLSLVPSAITKEAPHSLRSFSAIIPLSLLWTLGLTKISANFKRYSIIVVGLIISITLVQFSTYFGRFVKNYNFENSTHWQFQYKQVFEKYRTEIDHSQKVIITDKYAQPYIFVLNALSFDSITFQLNKRVNPVNDWGVSTISSFDKFEFREATKDDLVEGNLIFTQKKIHQEDGKIYSPNGEVLLYVYTN